MNYGVARWVRDVALSCDRLSHAARSVLGWLGQFAGRDGCAWPSTSTLAALTGLHPANVRRAVRELESVGAFRVEARSGRTNIYVFPVQTAVHTPRGGARGQDVEPRAVAREGARGGARGGRAVARDEVVNEVATEDTRARPPIPAEWTEARDRYRQWAAAR